MIKITYLGHSGFLIETKETYMLFDYYKGELPEFDLHKEMYVFVSHIHYDHYSRKIFELREKVEKIYYILSSDIASGEADRSGDIIFMDPGREEKTGRLTVRTLRSTDEGVAFLVHQDDRCFYHAGDLNWWHWEEEGRIFNEMMSRKYRSEIDKLKGMTIDLAFVPLDHRLGDSFYLGMDYFMRRTDTKCVFPMHMCGTYKVIDRLYELKESEPYREQIMWINRKGQRFQLEGE